MELLLENYSVFSERIVDIAKKFGLDTWNWFAIISSLIAVVSVVIAIKTLISQRATQRNTQPIMSKANLRILLGQKTLSILDSYLHLLTFQFFLYISDYRIKPSLHFWEQVKTDWADINEGLFFDHEQKYASIHHLREVLHEFNYSLRCFANTINTSDDKEYKELEIISIFNKVGLILNSIYDVLTTCLELNKEEVESFFNKNFIDVFETKYVLAFKHRYLKPDGKVVLHYFDDTDSSILMNDVYHYFAQIAFFFLEDLFEIDKDKFVVNISRHVDQLIMITPVDGSIISLKVKEKEAESKKGKNFSLVGDAQKDYNISNWESHKITSNDNHGSPIQIGESLWNYYLKTY